MNNRECVHKLFTLVSVCVLACVCMCLYMHVHVCAHLYVRAYVRMSMCVPRACTRAPVSGCVRVHACVKCRACVCARPIVVHTSSMLVADVLSYSLATRRRCGMRSCRMEPSRVFHELEGTSWKSLPSLLSSVLPSLLSSVLSSSLTSQINVLPIDGHE